MWSMRERWILPPPLRHRHSPRQSLASGDTLRYTSPCEWGTSPALTTLTKPAADLMIRGGLLRRVYLNPHDSGNWPIRVIRGHNGSTRLKAYTLVRLQSGVSPPNGRKETTPDVKERLPPARACAYMRLCLSACERSPSPVVPSPRSDFFRQGLAILRHACYILVYCQPNQQTPR